MSELLSYLAIPRRTTSIARFLALCIAEDCEAGEARILPADVLFASDQQVDLWPSPDQTLRRRAADCVGLVRILGAVDGVEVGCVPSPGVGFHVFLVAAKGEIIDPCVARGMTQPRPSFYRQKEGSRVRIVRPSTFDIGREVAGKVVMERWPGASAPSLLTSVYSAVKAAVTHVGPARRQLPVGGETLAVLIPMVKAATAAQPAAAATFKAVAVALTELYTEAHKRASLEAALDAMAMRSSKAAAMVVTTAAEGNQESFRPNTAAEQAVMVVRAYVFNPEATEAEIRNADPITVALMKMGQAVVNELKSLGTPPSASLNVGAPAAEPLSLLLPIIKAAISASPIQASPVKMLALALTELHTEARFRASLDAAITEITARAATTRANGATRPRGEVQPISPGSYNMAVVAMHTVTTRADLIPQALQSSDALHRAALVMAQTVFVDLQEQGIVGKTRTAAPAAVDVEEETADETAVDVDDDDDDDDAETAGAEVEDEDDDDDAETAGAEVEEDDDEDDDDAETAGVEVEEDDDAETAGVGSRCYVAPTLLPEAQRETPPGCPGSCWTTY